MTGVVITGGKRPPYDKVRELLNQADYRVAADSGADYCAAAGVTPDYAVGDMDSLENEAFLASLPPDQVERHSEEKDFTDTELALNHLYARGVNPIALIGGGGGRPDHFLGLYALFFRERTPDLWVTHNSIFVPVDGDAEFAVRPGERLSFFPLAPRCRMRSHGLRWPLGALRWEPGDCGVSNRAEGTLLRIRMEEGRLLMVRELKEAVPPLG